MNYGLLVQAKWESLSNSTMAMGKAGSKPYLGLKNMYMAVLQVGMCPGLEKISVTSQDAKVAQIHKHSHTSVSL